MRKVFWMIAVAIVFLFTGNLQATAEEKKHEEGEMKMEGIKHSEEGEMKMEGMKHSEEGGKKMEGMKHSAVSCAAVVHLTKEAELKMGGGLYDGKLPKAAKKMATMRMGVMASSSMIMGDKKSKEMEGSHNVHKGERGGEFIMVPNQLHHMEIVYTHECGFQLFMYNAFTESISADRFQAFILVLPESGDKFFEVMRFLTPASDGGFLHTPIAHRHDNPENPTGTFEVELYIKFPESIHPRMFELVVEPGGA